MVGGGIHGAHLALVLRSRGVPEHRLRILDPHPRLLARWTEWTRRTGLRYLRSPGVHHVALDPFDLIRYASRRGRARDGLRGRTRRPSLELFQRHSRHTLDEGGIEGLHLRGSMVGVESRHRGVLTVNTDRGALRTRRLLLAPGAGPHLTEPSWATPIREAGGPIHHLFGPDFPVDDMIRAACGSGHPVAILGGGISAAQLALRLVRGEVPVALISRHTLRIHRLDSDPGWMGPKHLRAFQQEPSPGARRAILESARHRGSVPERVARALRAASTRGDLTLRLASEVTGVRVLDAAGEPGASALGLELGHSSELRAAALILATGSGKGVPGTPWLDGVARSLQLPRAPCGYPVVDSALHWGAGIHVSGGLADLELGPAARNIVGARMAGERLRTLVNGGNEPA